MPANYSRLQQQEQQQASYRAPHATVASAAAASSAPSYPAISPATDYVRIISREGEEFLVHAACAKVSRLLAAHIAQSAAPGIGPTPPPTQELVVTAEEVAPGSGCYIPIPASLAPNPGAGTTGGPATTGQLLAAPFRLPQGVKWAEYCADPEISEAQKQDAIRSLTLFPYVSPRCTEAVTTTIRFPYTPAVLLEIVIRYLYYHHRYEGKPESRPEFKVPPEHALELMRVATLLQC